VFLFMRETVTIVIILILSDRIFGVPIVWCAF